MTTARRLPHAKSLDLLTHIGQIMSSSKSLDTILRATMNIVKTMLDVERCSILILDGHDKTLHMKAASNIPSELWDAIRIESGNGICGKVALDGKALLVEDIDSSQFASLANHTRYNTSSFLCVPLLIKGRVIGVINANNKSDAARFGREDLDIMAALASFTALTIDNSRLFSTSEDIRARMENIVESLHVAVLTLNLKRRITLANARLERLFGLEHGSATGRPLDKVLPQQLLDKVNESFSETVRYRVESRAEVEYVSDEKEKIPLEINLSALADAAGKVDGVLVTIIDVSMRREIDELRRLDELKSNFMSMVSHELRTPLTAIKGAAHLLLGTSGTCLAEEQLSLVTIVQHNEERLSRLVSDLLDIVHIENSTLSVSKLPTDLGALVDSCVVNFNAAAASKSIVIERQISPVSVWIDRERIKQAINHLMDNAIKFTPNGGQIVVSTTANGNHALVSIRDTGCGISPDSHGHLFTKFFQAEHPLTRKAGGAGIGLFMAKSIVELHGGSIKVESAQGMGAEFLIELPLS